MFLQADFCNHYLRQRRQCNTGEPKFRQKQLHMSNNISSIVRSCKHTRRHSVRIVRLVTAVHGLRVATHARGLCRRRYRLPGTMHFKVSEPIAERSDGLAHAVHSVPDANRSPCRPKGAGDRLGRPTNILFSTFGATRLR